MKNKSIYFLLLFSSLLLISCSDEADSHFETLTENAVILAFGDSLTSGKGASRSQSYPAILQQLSNKKVINAGISGEVSASGLVRLPRLLEKYQPELIIICHGGNDILRHINPLQTKSNITKMIKLAKSYNTQILLLAIPKPTLLLTPAAFYSEIAETTGSAFDQDTIAVVLKDRNLKSDTYHPNSAGYAVIARRIHDKLTLLGAI